MRLVSGMMISSAALLGACGDAGPAATERDWTDDELRPALYEYVERVSACDTGVKMRRLVIMDEGTYQPDQGEIVVRYRYNYVCEDDTLAFSTDDAAVFARRDGRKVKVFRSDSDEKAERSENRARRAAG